MGVLSRGRLAGVLAVLAAVAAGGTATDAAPLPTFAGTTVITARGNAGVALTMPRNSLLDLRNRDPRDHAVTMTRRGGTYAFVGVSEPDACRVYNDPETRMCMAIHGYDLGSPSGVQEVVTTDPAMLGKGRIEVYVLTDGEVTLTLRFKGMTGTRRVRADRRVAGRVQELPRTCAPRCGDVAFGGAAYDVGKAGFVASFAAAERDVEVPAPVGTQYAASCIYRGTGPGAPSSDPATHPAGCDGSDMVAFPDPDPRSGVSGWNSFDYGGTGSVYVGFHAAVVQGTGAWQRITAYGVWVSDGLR
jgi:hypothetical protein